VIAREHIFESFCRPPYASKHYGVYVVLRGKAQPQSLYCLHGSAQPICYNPVHCHAFREQTMNAPTTDIGTLQRTTQGFEGVLSRQLDHDAGAVWRMLTDPQAMAQWLAPGSIEPRAGGTVRIDFADSGTVIDSRVTAFEDGRLLAYSWSSGSEPERPMRWDLAPVDGGTRLTLTLQIPANEDAAKACAGFEGHLDMLAAALEGVPIKFPFQRFLQARGAYQAQLAG